MAKVHIVTDSNCNIPAALCQELDIHVVPLPFVLDGATYIEYVDVGPKAFFPLLRNAKSVPTTSGPTPGAFKETFEKLAADGNPILSILVGRHFSSTLLSAETAKKELPDVDLTLIDSESNAMALGFQVLATARAASRGERLGQLVEIVHQAMEATGIFFSVRDLEYLYRGGRIGFAQRLLGSALDIFPIFEIRRSPIHLVERQRTFRKVISRLLDLVEQRLADGRPYRLAVLHADDHAGANALMSAALERFDPEELLVNELSPVLSVHTGQGALGVAYSSGL
ncbi:MAG TPA: DegV family protein [Anaerolineales bacterium]|jgi:DegV family protein with EDD domain|nr:DegV family protein [Anaerolineales bacterium]